MAKGGGAAAALLLGAAVVAGGYFFLSGGIPGYGTGTPDVNPGSAVDKGADVATKAGESSLDWFVSTAWAPAALIAVVGAWFAVKLWDKIGSFGRGTVIALVAICVTIFIMGIKH